VETGRELAALKQQQHQLVHSAFHDPLTGLPNRTLLCDRIGQVLNQADRNRHESALLFCDLDGFKFINDNMGHAAGDKVLQTVSERLLQCVRSEDTVARIGGDEFVVVLAHIESADHTRVVAQKILDALALELCVEGAEIALSGSVGIAVYPFDGESAERLIRNADAAMYRAKEGGKNHFRFYTEPATTQADASRSIVLRVAPWHERTGNNRILQQYAI
jgi:diguanylate cyclase (GGDEF)-like protein